MPADTPDHNFLQAMKQGWVAGYPPWFFNFWIRHAQCKTDEEKSHLLQFLRALEDGKPDEASRLLSGIDPNVRLATEGSRSQSLLEWAAEKCQNPDCVRLLIKAGASLKAPMVVTQLASFGKTDLLAEVLAAGADPNLAPPGCAPLLSACWQDAKIVRLLLEAGARTEVTSTVYITNKKKVTKVTPLMIAAYAGHPQIVTLLLEAGANPKAVDSAGNTAIAWAKISRAKAKAAKIIPLLETAGTPQGAVAGVSEPVDFALRAKSPEFQQALGLCKKLTKSAGKPIELEVGPLPGGKVFGLRKGEPSVALLEQLRPQVEPLGALAFLSRGLLDFGSDCLVLLPSKNYREAVVAFETPVGQSMDCYELIAWLDKLEKTQPFVVTHIAPDLFRARFTTDIKDSATLIKSIEKICGDVINESLEAAARRLEQSRELYLWWD